jgi:lipopolysaccharide transport system ATP-binding protein
MSEVILSVENVSKLYRLGTVGTGTFGGDVQRFWKTKILGQEDPFLKLGQINDRTSKEKADFVWALQDVNFEVKRGEVLGIIGKNGAGKSTLLKLLSRITAPTTGIIKSAGRMASLLEVGTGFHPELTGRENIFLNGAILGMTKKEIQSKFDEIVDFSGCELYIDTPTKRYSSGMTVRLGFAVAAFLDPEILVVDEVLAVGDAEFQKKAIGKMKEVSQGEGRTILFVSHNMDAISKLCTTCIEMRNGRIHNQGATKGIIEHYLDYYNDIILGFNRHNSTGTGANKICGVNLIQDGMQRLTLEALNKNVQIKVDFDNSIDFSHSVYLDIGIYNTKDQFVAWLSSRVVENNFRTKHLTISIEDFNLGKGVYKLNLFLSEERNILDYIVEGFVFEVIREMKTDEVGIYIQRPEPLVQFKYHINYD